MPEEPLNFLNKEPLQPNIPASQAGIPAAGTPPLNQEGIPGGQTPLVQPQPLQPTPVPPPPLTPQQPQAAPVQPQPPPLRPPTPTFETVSFEPPQGGVETMKQVAAPPAPKEPVVIREVMGEISHAGIPATQLPPSQKSYKALYIIVSAIGILVLLSVGFYLFIWPKLQKQTETVQQPTTELPPLTQAPETTSPETTPPETPETPTQPPALPEVPSAPEAEVPASIPEVTSTATVTPSQTPTSTPNIEESEVTIVFNKNNDVWGWVLADKIYLRWNPKTYSYFTVAERIGGSTTWNTIAKSIPFPEYERTTPLAAKRIDFRIQGVDRTGKVLESYLLISFNL